MKREPIKTVKFENKGTFEAYYAACNWCNENGYSYGSMCGSEPIALWMGERSISKWKNLSTKERATCDGVMMGEFREGAVTILIYN
jgi:hypothetical protein